jgi:hypothetical protein
VVEAKDVTVNVLTSAVTTLVIIFLLIPLLKIPVPAVREVETIETKKYYYPYVTPVVLEGDYSTWTKITDVVLDTSDQTYNVFAGLLYIDHANQKVIMDDRVNKRLLSCSFDGTNYAVLASGDDYRGGVSGSYFSEVKGASITSVLGKYSVVLDDTTGNVYVLKNGAIIQTIVAAHFTQNVGISSNGQYIVIIDSSTNYKRLRLIVYQGS